MLPDQPELNHLQETYYKGICQPSKNPKEFCYTEFLSFTFASLYAPLILIAILYGPTLCYIISLSIKFHGRENYFSKILDDPITLVFPIFTNISFYKIEDEPQGDTDTSKSIGNSQPSTPGNNDDTNRTLWTGLVQTPAKVAALDVGGNESRIPGSLEIVDETIFDGSDDNDDEVFEAEDATREDVMNIEVEDNEEEEVRAVVEEYEENVDDYEIRTGVVDESRTEEMAENKTGQKSAQISESQGTPSKSKEPNFSLHQSIILYGMYVFGFSLSLLLDVFIQFSRKGWGKLHISTRYGLLILAINILLWLDFVREFIRKKAKANSSQPKHWLTDTIIFSTNSLVCLLLLPIWGIYRLYQR